MSTDNSSHKISGKTQCRQQIEQDIAAELGILAPSKLELIDSLVFGDVASSKVKVWCKRDDLLHPVISGNKWRKLAPILSDLMQNKVSRVLSFGGAYSNHLHALAYCCMKLNIQLVAIVRGHKPDVLSATLQDIDNWGAQLHFVSRIEYRNRENPLQLQEYQHRFKTQEMIPEGGSNKDSLNGLKSLIAELDQSGIRFDQMYVPVGSGATMAGLIKYGHKVCQAITGIAVLKGNGYLESIVSNLLTNDELTSLDTGNVDNASMHVPWQINHEYHHGGYAKCSPVLQSFISEFTQRTNIPIEKVYSAKCFYAAYELLKAPKAQSMHNIVIIHTGGIQGARLIKSI